MVIMSVEANLGTSSSFEPVDLLAQNARSHDKAIALAETFMFIGGVCAPQMDLNRVAAVGAHMTTNRLVASGLRSRHMPPLRPVALTLANAVNDENLFEDLGGVYLNVNSASTVLLVERKVHEMSSSARPVAITGVATPRKRSFDRLLMSTPDVIASTGVDWVSRWNIGVETIRHWDLFLEYGRKASGLDTIGHAALVQHDIPMDLVAHPGDQYFLDTLRESAEARRQGVNVHVTNGAIGHNAVIVQPVKTFEEYFISKELVLA